MRRYISVHQTVNENESFEINCRGGEKLCMNKKSSNMKFSKLNNFNLQFLHQNFHLLKRHVRKQNLTIEIGTTGFFLQLKVLKGKLKCLWLQAMQKK